MRIVLTSIYIRLHLAIWTLKSEWFRKRSILRFKIENLLFYLIDFYMGSVSIDCMNKTSKFSQGTILLKSMGSALRFQALRCTLFLMLTSKIQDSHNFMLLNSLSLALPRCLAFKILYLIIKLIIKWEIIDFWKLFRLWAEFQLL